MCKKKWNKLHTQAVFVCLFVVCDFTLPQRLRRQSRYIVLAGTKTSLNFPCTKSACGHPIAGEKVWRGNVIWMHSHACGRAKCYLNKKLKILQNIEARIKKFTRSLLKYSVLRRGLKHCNHKLNNCKNFIHVATIAPKISFEQNRSGLRLMRWAIVA